MPTVHRLVLLFPGFEKLPVGAHCRRFIREARRSLPVYGWAAAVTQLPDISRSTGGVTTGRFVLTATKKGRTISTEVVVYGLDDLSAVYARSNVALRILRGLAGLADFLVTGAFIRYLATSWRYGLFFLYPLMVLVGALLGAISGFLIMAKLTDPGFWPLLAGASVGLLLLWLATARLHLLLVMDDWAFARDLARSRRPDLLAAMRSMSEDAGARIAAGASEVVLAAHSLGAVSAVTIAASLVQRRLLPDSAGLLTVGSSLLKIALHPRARGLREDVSTIVAGRLPWLDVQALTDPINFYKADTQGALGIGGERTIASMRVRFRHQLEPAAYRRLRRSFFRTHRQFVYGVDRPTPYSFHAILCGPESFRHIARRPGLNIGRSETSGGYRDEKKQT